MTNEDKKHRKGSSSSSSSKASTLPLVPESVLKRRHDLDDMARRRAAERAALGLGNPPHKARGKGGGSAKKDGGTRTLYVKKPETILAAARSRRNHLIRYRRVRRKGMQKRAKNSPDFATRRLEGSGIGSDIDSDVDADVKKKYQTNSVGAKMVLAIRIRDDVGAPRPVKKILRDMGLDRAHAGVFLRYHDENRRLLHLVEPWVVYGPPSRALVMDLVERRGHGGRQRRLIVVAGSDGSNRSSGGASAKSAGERIPLSDNTVIEAALGASCNVVCKEDLVHEICHVGPHFDDVAAWLWPFALEDAKSHFQRRTLKAKDGRDEYGDRGEAIADYVQQVL